MRFLKILARSLVDFFRDDGMMLAGSMSYFTMMALVPLGLFLVTLLGYFLGEYPGFYRFFVTKLTGFFPEVTQEITNDISKLITYKGIGAFSLALYWFLSYQVFVSVEFALNRIFKVKKRRHVFLSLLVSLALVTMIIILLIASFGAATMVPVLKALGPFLPGIRMGMITKIIIQFVLPFVILLFTMMLLYLLVPKARVKPADAFLGACFTALFLETAKHAFTWYVRSVAHFGRIYGSLTAVVMFLLWMFYSSGIFLIGAEIVHNLGNTRKAGRLK